MLSQLLTAIATYSVLTFHTSVGAPVPTVLAEHTYSLADRYGVPSVNTVFADNILLTINYMVGQVKNAKDVDWKKVTEPFSYQIVLEPGQTFAFHDDVLPQYQGKIAKTTNAHFNAQDGFQSDGYLYGDGVCHLASFMNVVAKTAGLTVEAPTRHDFAAIPEVSPENGVSIYDDPGTSSGDQLQNLYVTNNKDKPIAFTFAHKGDNLTISVVELN